MGTFGERLHDAMTATGMPATELARLCGVSRQTVASWLRMKDADLSGAHLVRTGIELGYSIRWLAIGTGTPVPIGLTEARKAQLTG